MPPGAVDDGSVDPAGFYLDIFQDVGELQQDEDDEVTIKDLFGDEDEMDLQVPAPAEADGGYEEVTLEALFGDVDDMDLQVAPCPAPAEDHGIYEEVTYGSLFGGDDMDLAAPAPAFVSCGSQPLHECTTPRSMLV
jgi:hypothetical protein